eukprot:TRINITY_DN30998_c0_g1_i3.p1 TRINITY_DN30998_c0_g1~~TRINITY_DN30998_c0_g1_i3.p1  ORF type:complete len:248 (+),score=12.89 TRINITY_DN30998_c0_g1_i3:64-807(+)
MADGWVKLPTARGATLRFSEAGASAMPSGCRLWAPAVILCGVLQAELQDTTALILELGAGVGAPGLYAAALGCSNVVLTDVCEKSLNLLSGNVKRFETWHQQNCSERPPHLRVRPLDFHNLESAPAAAIADIRRCVDIILAGDVCYEPGAPKQLVEAIDVCLSPIGRAYIAYRDRPATPVDAELREEAARRSLYLTDLGAADAFASGLAVLGIPQGSISSCVDERTHVVCLRRVDATSTPVGLDQMD